VVEAHCGACDGSGCGVRSTRPLAELLTESPAHWQNLTPDANLESSLG